EIARPAGDRVALTLSAIFEVLVSAVPKGLMIPETASVTARATETVPPWLMVELRASLAIAEAANIPPFAILAAICTALKVAVSVALSGADTGLIMADLRDSAALLAVNAPPCAMLADDLRITDGKLATSDPGRMN